MHSALRLFIRQFTGVVLATLVPVALVAFLSIPYSLGGHPGDERLPNRPAALHLT